MRNEYLNIQHPDQYSSPRLREINRSPDSQDSELHLARLAVELVKRRRRILITGIRFERERERNKRSFFFLRARNDNSKTSFTNNSFGIRDSFI